MARILENRLQTTPLHKDIIKTKEDFLNNYEKHDIGIKHVVDILKTLGYHVIYVGADIRRKPIQILSDIPDLLVYPTPPFPYILIEVKTKTDPLWIGKFNERAYNHYKNIEWTFRIPTAVVYVLLDDNAPISTSWHYLRGKYGKIISQETAWDGNIIVVYKYFGGLLGLDLSDVIQ